MSEATFTPAGGELKAPTPIDDPLALRDAIASDYRANLLRRGVDAPFDLFQDIAAADLMLVDAAERDIERAVTKPVHVDPTPSVQADEHADVTVAREAEERSVGPIGIEAEFAKWATSEKKMKLIARIQRICQPILGAVGDTVHFTHCAYPRWARQCVRAVFDAEQARRQYRGRSIAERQRILFREFEDIADRSRVDLGPWWVK